MKILISTPCYQYQVHSEMVKSLLGVVSHLKDKNYSVQWDTPVSSILSYSRNLSVDHAIEDGYDWLLFWDSDISVKEPDFVEKMIETAYKNKVDIVGLPIALKGGDKYNFGWKKNGVYENGVGYYKGEVDVIGTGIMLIKVSLFSVMNQPYFTFTDTFNGKSGFWPEDWNFCEKASVFTKILSDNRFDTAHWGQHAFK